MDEESQIEEVVSAYRERGPMGEVRFAPAFYDLDTHGRRAAFERSVEQRRLEALLDARGLSTTSHAVLARIQKRA